MSRPHSACALAGEDERIRPGDLVKPDFTIFDHTKFITLWQIDAQGFSTYEVGRMRTDAVCLCLALLDNTPVSFGDEGTRMRMFVLTEGCQVGWTWNDWFRRVG